MTTVDLPAHNVWEISAGPQTTIVGGHEALADETDLTSYVELGGSGFVGGAFAVGATSVGSGGGGANGFGLFTLPAGATFDGAEFVALGYRTGGHDVSEPTRSTGASGFYSVPVDESPGLTAFYSGQGYHEALADFPIGSSSADAVEVTAPVARTDYVQPPGPPATGTFGLCPEFDWDAFDATVTASIFVYYLAIRVTYTDGGTGILPAAVPSEGIAPLRQHPRTDGLGTSSAPRLWPPSRSIQASNRRGGGYY